MCYLLIQALCKERLLNVWEADTVRGVASPATSEATTSLRVSRTTQAVFRAQ